MAINTAETTSQRITLLEQELQNYEAARLTIEGLFLQLSERGIDQMRRKLNHHQSDILSEALGGAR